MKHQSVIVRKQKTTHNMKLEQQVTSLEISSRLKELGVNQNSLFAWWKKICSLGEEHFELEVGATKSISDSRVKSSEKVCSAFTASELGEMFPHIGIMESRTVGGGWRYDFGDQQAIYGETEADARGKMLIYLLKTHSTHS